MPVVPNSHVGAVHLSYERSPATPNGAEVPLVLLPVAFAGDWIWANAWPRLVRAGYDVIRIRSPFALLPSDVAGSIEALGDCVRDLLDDLGIERAVICGNSIGATPQRGQSAHAIALGRRRSHHSSEGLAGGSRRVAACPNRNHPACRTRPHARGARALRRGGRRLPLLLPAVEVRACARDSVGRAGARIGPTQRPVSARRQALRTGVLRGNMIPARSDHRCLRSNRTDALRPTGPDVTLRGFGRARTRRNA